ncbi:MAG: sugar ABC transporter substrate-binding protein [Verrucomicrobiales bacterium]|jgi:ribose transport system substrate-binding protein|nr:sugar ABC transporter substrate-binding protein [Verrucomicrobiales bacterium]MBP9223682.1 sugar ABC transporter substrate-binding protein [Verrucomicrobiales bacterium]
MKHFLLLPTALIFFSFGSSSCSQNSSPDARKNDKPVVALIMKSLANEFFKTMADGAEQYQTEHADEFELIVNGIKNETDLAQQVALVEQMVARGVDAIVIAPADSKAIVPSLKRAQDAGIIVINIDNKLNAEVLSLSDASIPFVGPDNRAGARLVGEALARTLKPSDQVAILEGVPTAFNAQERRAGLEEAMKTAGMEVVSIQSAQWEMEKANTVTSAILTSHPGLAAILASNDSMALGAAAAVKAAGREKSVKIVGFDNISAVQSLIKEGRIFATVDQHGDELAVFGIQRALSLLGGESASGDQSTPVELITVETLP